MHPTVLRLRVCACDRWLSGRKRCWSHPTHVSQQTQRIWSCVCVAPPKIVLVGLPAERLMSSRTRSSTESSSKTFVVRRHRTCLDCATPPTHHTSTTIGLHDEATRTTIRWSVHRWPRSLQGQCLARAMEDCMRSLSSLFGDSLMLMATPTPHDLLKVQRRSMSDHHVQSE